MSGCSGESWAFHWYSPTPFTLRLVFVTVVVCAVHDSTPACPHFTTAEILVWSVPKFTVALPPTTSVRYG